MFLNFETKMFRKRAKKNNFDRFEAYYLVHKLKIPAIESAANVPWD